MTFLATPDPLTEPPSVELDYTLDTPGSIVSYTITRNGDTLRFNTVVSGDQIILTDFEAPYGIPLTYSITGTFIPDSAPDWTESWGSLASWTGDTADWSVAAGVASSSLVNADITRSATGTIQRIDVANPHYVRVELLDAADVVVASVQVTSNVTVAGTSSSSVAGGGSFSAVLDGGSILAGALDNSWSVSEDYTGVPTKVRIVSVYPVVVPGTAFSTGLSILRGPWVDTSGNIFVLDYPNQMVRKYNSSGVLVNSWSTTHAPIGLWGDTSGNIFVITQSGATRLVRKYDSSGVAGITWSTTDPPYAIWGDTSGNIFVTTSSGGTRTVRKYNSSGVAGITWAVGGSNLVSSMWGDTSGNIFVLTQTGSTYDVRKYDSAGVAGATWSVGSGTAAGIWGDTAGFIYTVSYTGSSQSTIRKWSSAGVLRGSNTLAGPLLKGLWGDTSGNLFSIDSSNSTDNAVRKYTPQVASIDDVSVYLEVTAQDFSEQVTTQLDSEDAWMVHPLTTSLSVNIHKDRLCQTGINVSDRTKKTRSSETKRVLLQPVGRTRAIAITQQDRMIPTWDLVLIAETVADRDEVDAFLAADVPFLLRSPASFEWDLPDDWYSIGSVTDERLADPLVLSCGHSFHLLTLPLDPVDPPTEPTPSSWTYGQDLLAYPTYADSLAAEPTYLDRLVGPSA